MEKIAEFQNRQGITLRGIFHIPECNSKDTGIIFVHSGVQGRHGNTNQYVFYAREFCKLGFTCLRFDPYGLGDSDGLIEPMDMRDYYGSIQTGRYVEDTIDAVNFFKSSEYGTKRIILFGLCGGAITSLLAGSFLKGLSGLVLLSVPTILDSSSIDYNIRIPKEIASTYIKSYFKKIFKIKYWLRFVSFKSNYKEIYGYVKAAFNKNDSEQQDTNNIKVNKYFLDSYKMCSINFRIHFIFGDNDSFWYEFKNNFYDKGLLKNDDLLTMIKDANHMFTIPEWQKYVLESSKSWITDIL